MLVGSSIEGPKRIEQIVNLILSESFVNTPMARVSRRRCSKSARLSVGDEAVAGIGVAAAAGAAAAAAAVGAAGTTDGRDCAAAAPVCLAGRVPGVDVVFAGLERFGGFTDDGARPGCGRGAGNIGRRRILVGTVVGRLGLAPGCSRRRATGCAAEAGGTAAGVTSRSALGEGASSRHSPKPRG